jgi:eukaryotic-like serine/threonine-protein kinase
MAAEPQKLKDQYLVGSPFREDELSILYEGKDTKTDGSVWLECFKENSINFATIQKLTNLASTLMRLDHPNLVKTLNFFAEGSRFWVVSEAVNGATLEAVLKDKTRLRTEEALEIILQVIKALYYAGKQLVTHGALGPDNIWIPRGGGVKVYGLSLRAVVINEILAKTHQLPVKGLYLAPEQFKGEFFRETSDLYALGVIFYQLLSGKPPFEAADNAALAHLHENQAPDLTHFKTAGYASEIISHLLKKNPAERYSSWEDLIRNLREKKILKDTTDLILPEKQAPLALKQAKDKEKKDREKITVGPRRSGKSGGLAYFLVGMLAGFALAFFLAPSGGLFPANEVTVPEVKNMPYQVADALLKQAKLKAEVAEELPSTEVVKGRVLFTDPRAGMQVKAGRTVKVILSAGSSLVKVPQLVGLSLEAAQKLLEGSGLEIQLTGDSESTANPQTLILAQNPLPGSDSKPGTKIEVSLVRSGTAGQVMVPDFSRQDFVKVKEMLNEKRLTLGRVIYQNSSEENKNLILRQNPRPGSQIATLMKVDFVIGGGPDAPQNPLHYARVEFNLPARERIWLVEIKVEDPTGIYSVYQKGEMGGKTVAWEVLGQGESTVKVYLDGSLIQEQRF